MFNFHSNLLKNAHYTFWGQRLKIEFDFSGYVLDKIEGRSKEHSDGNCPREVAEQSLKETRITVIPPKRPPADVNILSIGTAIAGMYDGPPSETKSRPLPVGAKVHLLTSIIIYPDKLKVLTTHTITEGKFNSLKATEISLEQWEAVYLRKTGETWELSEREAARRQKSQLK